jgi:eukaryotic-like serine/threonine-protein kinase
MRCPTCGFENSGTAKFCAECGVRIAPASSSAQIPGAELSLQPTLGPAPAADSPASTPSAESLFADRYQVQRTLGQGGMGAVYLATDTKPGMGGRGVAIKRILDADDQGVQRFLRESETIATLNHQNIRAVYDRGEDAQGHFLVMEYIDGETLHDRVAKNGALDDSAFADLAQGLGKALSFAHKKSVIHRDVKPANVMFTGDGTPKLTDFGLARMGHESDLSMTGYGMGTLDYASPEQRRDAKSADHRSDIYGLGATLYFATTGESPKTIRESRIPIRWRSVILKCLEEKPEIRYFSIDDLLNEIQSTHRVHPEPTTSSSESLTCSSCGYENPLGTRFCRSCGQGLVEECPSCHEEVFSGGEFCGNCGQDLSPAALEKRTAAIAEAEASRAFNPFLAEGWTVEDGTPSNGGYAKKLKDSKTGITFILVEPGTFQMGSPNNEKRRGQDETQHTVELTKPFYLGETLVTQAQWKKLIRSNPSHLEGDSLPVENVSWDDCQDYLEKAGSGYRLPTEAEWEYACRAGTKTRFHSGDSNSSLDFVGWYGGIFRGKSQPVAQKQSNAWGFFDTHGNVWEWCQDWYEDYSGGKDEDPQGPPSGKYRVLRGGSWNNRPGLCRSANRNRGIPVCRYGGDCGFRVARTLP